nr:hypothetical protein [Morchella crassipes]
MFDLYLTYCLIIVAVALLQLPAPPPPMGPLLPPHLWWGGYSGGGPKNPWRPPEGASKGGGFGGGGGVRPNHPRTPPHPYRPITAVIGLVGWGGLSWKGKDGLLRGNRYSAVQFFTRTMPCLTQLHSRTPPLRTPLGGPRRGPPWVLGDPPFQNCLGPKGPWDSKPLTSSPHLSPSSPCYAGEMHPSSLRKCYEISCQKVLVNLNLTPKRKINRIKKS